MQIEPNSYSESWHMRVVKTLDEIETIRPIWEQMQAAEPYPVVNVCVDRYLSVLQAGGAEYQPLIVLFYRDEKPYAMLIGRRERRANPVRFGYKTIVNLRLDCMTVLYGGVLGQPDRALSRMVVTHLYTLMKQEGLHAVTFNHLRVDSDFYQQVRRIPCFLCRNCRPVVEAHWRMSVPQELDDFFKSLSKRHRSNLRRTIRQFKERFGNEIRVEHLTQQEDVEGLCADVETVSRRTYQHALGEGFCNNSFFQSILHRDAINGRLLMSVLYVAEQPCAFQWGTVIDKTYFLEKIGYDPHWTEYGVGNVLFVEVLNTLCRGDRIKHIDFGFGDAQYKRSYGDDCWQEAAETYVFAPKVYPLVVNMVCGVGVMATSVAGWIVRTSGMYDWTKKKWRQHLRRRAQKSTGESSHE